MNRVKILVLMCLIFSCSILPQSISIGLGGGVNFITGDNYYTNGLGRLGIFENINGTTGNLEGMGLTNELHLQLGVKYFFDNSPFSLRAVFSYSPLRGTEQKMIYDFVLMAEVPKDVTAKMDIWGFQAGTDYYFNFYPFKPFFTVSLSANYFDDFYVEFSQPDYKSEYRSYKNGMRYGYSVGAGIAYYILSNLNLELSGSFNSFNVLNKREGEELLNSINIQVSIYYQII